MDGNLSLETPKSYDELYLARDDAADYAGRPAFTGDVFVLDKDRHVALVQHPCSLRHGGFGLNERVLVASVVPAASKPRSDWARESYRVMPLPDLRQGEFWQIDFEDLDTVPGSALALHRRNAILSELGVNLLLQRWVHHSSRVVVPTHRFARVTSGPFCEVELAEEAASLSDDDDLGVGMWKLLDAWLDEKRTGSLATRRQELNEPQLRSSIRRELRQVAPQWLM